MNHQKLKNARAFTLIELLVAIAIIATLIGLAIPNFLGARSRAKDARRKGEMQQLKNALQLYYNDYHIYPAAANGTAHGVSVFNYIAGCGASGTTLCPAGCTSDFASGGSGCDTVYTAKFPGELGSSMFYYQRNSGADFCLKDSLENASDGDITTTQSKCATTCTGLYSGTDYIVCSE
jgi:prepilin-type N-terminal cleavage/methylation domain-containing protein